MKAPRPGATGLESAAIAKSTYQALVNIGQANSSSAGRPAVCVKSIIAHFKDQPLAFTCGR
jgi:hypothetical protein